MRDHTLRDRSRRRRHSGAVVERQQRGNAVATDGIRVGPSIRVHRRRAAGCGDAGEQAARRGGRQRFREAGDRRGRIRRRRVNEVGRVGVQERFRPGFELHGRVLVNRDRAAAAAAVGETPAFEAERARNRDTSKSRPWDALVVDAADHIGGRERQYPDDRRVPGAAGVIREREIAGVVREVVVFSAEIDEHRIRQVAPPCIDPRVGHTPIGDRSSDALRSCVDSDRCPIHGDVLDADPIRGLICLTCEAVRVDQGFGIWTWLRELAKHLRHPAARDAKARH